MRIGGTDLGGATTEIVFLLRPEHVETILADRVDNSLREFERLRLNFDAKPLVVGCSKLHCEREADKVTALAGSAKLIFWCQECYPGLHRAAARGSLTTIATFSDALRHVDRTFSTGRKSAKRSIIRNLANAKGLGPRVRERSAREFFSTPVSGGPWVAG